MDSLRAELSFYVGCVNFHERLSDIGMDVCMFVPAHSVHASFCVSLFTHFRRGEDASMKSGKLDKELARMSGIVDRFREGSMLLLNESFAATNKREGSEIARVIVRALMERREDGSRTYRLEPGEPLETSFGKDLYEEVFREERRE